MAQGADVEFLSVAVDAQGAEKARPFVDKTGATFTTVVDAENLLGQLYGFKAIPNGYLIDERGIVQYKRLGGFDIRRSETASVVKQWIGASSMDDSVEATALSLGSEHSQANAYFRTGLRLYRQGKVDEAMSEWRKGVELEPDNYIIRKQLWAVQNPDRFYSGKVDFDWQKEQMAKGL